ncbi:unnamed protein product [Mytilus coruscus]|uniref:ATP-dependent DNA helicase n=1 Tax=Mytilus coruscus TaxID=42192 RepID=A0A6J8A3S8_MYTCO|nr:unnamed protein product [Mytilus coruscus]
MGTLLQAVSKETADQGIKQQMKKCAKTFQDARSVSAQEAVYRLLGLPLLKSDFQTIWIPSGMPHERVHLLKPKYLLSNMEDDEENVFVTGIEDKYAVRPQALENWNLALTQKSTNTRHQDESIQPDLQLGDSINNESIPFDVNIQKAPEEIGITTSQGESFTMKKRRKQWCNARLFRKWPWETDWDLISPETQHENLQHQQENEEIDPQFEHLDTDQLETSQQESTHVPTASVSKSCPVTSEIFNQLVSEDEYRCHIRSLNDEQRTVFQMVLNWCKDVITAKQKSEQPPPLYSFISGGAVTGKSHLIKALHQMVLRTLRKEGEIHRRLQEIFQSDNDFAAISILAFGDLYQLPPVCQKFVFQQSSDDYASLCVHLWDNFKLVELTKIMRQRDDAEFGRLLNRVRDGSQTNEDQVI